MTELYQVQELSFRYGAVPVLQGIAFATRAGEFIGIIGPNGSGKTTLLKLLSAILKPNTGKIEFGGMDLRSWNRHDLAQKMAVVPQETAFLYTYTVLEIVLMGRAPFTSLFGFDRPEDLRIALESLKQVGLLDMADRSIQTLSGGERQMVVIARALTQQPEVLLLDEPTAYLDIRHQQKIYNLLTRLNKEQGLTVVVVSHDLNLAGQYCHRLIMLSDGQTVADGTAEKVLTKERIEAVYGCQVLIDRHPMTGRPRMTLVPHDAA
ncbi:MAG TPA: ABC transporter ATP-binding protein [Nitrospiria bacterium]|jgi:iron complex transport system ATP-binding protein|nr:ABC transporter ATP-binding protein [Nitrospiria bacterium]